MFNMSYDFLIPFMFVLAIVFGSLELTKVFKNKAVHFMIAFVVAFFAATYQPFLTTLWANMVYIVWFFIAMFFIAFISKIAGLRGGKQTTSESMVIYGVVLFILFAIGWSTIDELNVSLPYIGGGENLALLIGLIVIGIIFYLAYRMGHVTQIEERYKKDVEEGVKKTRGG